MRVYGILASRKDLINLFSDTAICILKLEIFEKFIISL